MEEVVRVSKPEHHPCLPRASRIRGHRSRWSEACSSGISTAQYIIYNIKKWGCLIAHVVQQKPTLLTFPDAFSCPPRPDQKKPSTTYPKRPLIRLPHHQCADPGADSLTSPHLRMNCADLAEDSCPGRISDHVLAPSRHVSQVSCHRGTQRPSMSHTKRNPTCVPVMGQDFPLTRPSPGANRPIYPSFPALVSRSLPEVRIPKRHESFFWMSRKSTSGDEDQESESCRSSLGNHKF